MATTKKTRTSVFVSYSHKDSEWLSRLKVHLRPLERDLAIDIWDDTKITSGSKWRAEIDAALRTARVAILLISADFLASDFIHNNELPPLLSAAEKEGALILPVIVSPSRFLRTEGLRDYQAVNPPSSPLIKMGRAEQEDIFVELTEHIETAMASNVAPKISGNPDEARRGNLRSLLNRVPLIVYFEDIAEEEAQKLYAELQASGMRPRGFGRELGYSGNQTIVYSRDYQDVAEHLNREHPMLLDFTLDRVHDHDGDPYEGIIINLW